MFRVDHNRLHVLPEHLGDGDVVALVRRLAHVDHAVVDAREDALEALDDLLFLLAPRVLVLVDAGVAELFLDIFKLALDLLDEP